jgi:YVTN family beta-propeller protein
LIEVGNKPEGISTHPDDRHVYVANWFDGTVSVIDGKTLKVVDTIKTGKGSRAFGLFFSK